MPPRKKTAQSSGSIFLTAIVIAIAAIMAVEVVLPGIEDRLPEENPPSPLYYSAALGHVVESGRLSLLDIRAETVIKNDDGSFDIIGSLTARGLAGCCLEVEFNTASLSLAENAEEEGSWLYGVKIENALSSLGDVITITLKRSDGAQWQTRPVEVVFSEGSYAPQDLLIMRFQVKVEVL